MNQRAKQKLYKRVDKFWGAFFDLRVELLEQNFPSDTPIMKDMNKINQILTHLSDDLTKSIPTRDFAARHKLVDSLKDE